MRPTRRQPTDRVPVLIVLCTLSAAAILLCYLFPPGTEDERLTALVQAMIPQFFVAAILLALVGFYDGELLRFKKVEGRALLWCLPPLLVAVVNFPFSALIGGGARIEKAEYLPLFLFKCLLIGCSEEWLFRGILFGALRERLQEQGKTSFLAVLISSLLFGAFHLLNLFEGSDAGSVLLQMGYSFLIGAMLCVVYRKTENLYLPILLHALFDVGGYLVSDLGTGEPQDVTFWILTAAAGVWCAVHVVMTLIKEIRREQTR